MAPKRKHRSNSKAHKAARHDRAAINNTNSLINGASMNINNLSGDNSSTSNVNESASANTAPHIEVQMAYVYFNRAWGQQSNVENYLTAAIGTSPMERWQSGSMLDDPRQGIEGVVVCEEPVATDADDMLSDTVAENPGVEVEEARSNICVAPTSEKSGRYKS